MTHLAYILVILGIVAVATAVSRNPDQNITKVPVEIISKGEPFPISQYEWFVCRPVAEVK